MSSRRRRWRAATASLCVGECHSMTAREPMRTSPPSIAPLADPSPAPPPERRVIEGRYVRVEPLDPAAHGADLYAASHGDEAKARIWAYLPYGPFATRDAFDAYIASNAVKEDPLFYAIRPHASGRTAGIATLMSIEPAHRSIEIGHIWLGPELQNTPAGTEALYLLIGYAMDELGYRRMEWKCDAANAASRGAAVRLGFTHEGLFYQHRIVKGRNRDTAWFSILDGEWPAIRANFEAWLDQSNFDEQGRQRQSLGDLNRSLTASRVAG
jgi:RimJ/RimL family protein N-acetyltransferase